MFCLISYPIYLIWRICSSWRCKKLYRGRFKSAKISFSNWDFKIKYSGWSWYDRIQWSKIKWWSSEKTTWYKISLCHEKPNPIDVTFKDKIKFDTQNPLIGMLLFQTEAGKLNINQYLTDAENQLYKVLVLSVKYQLSVGLYRLYWLNIGSLRFLP